ncbi:MAG: hypothetical protein COZ21_06375 [Bacteroidetes bacterium CG_4_10_14_3_um_filter_31_20]|nr:MAG: hypothetical protein COZ21_06375 [Bacteroidetes bacterium CG_4_10_14_3_um_filter_31_20]
MKSKMFLFVVAIASTATIISCTKSKNEKISPEQQVLLGKMNVAYNNAKLYNDSLIYSTNNNSNLTSIVYYDNNYHSNDSMFNHCHSSMMNTDGGMMGGNGGMMGGSGGMLGNNSMCNSQNAQLNQVITQMSQLREIHNNYHPIK